MSEHVLSHQDKPMPDRAVLEKLIFVYNADTGFFATVSDFAHKILSPQTYACPLCKLTYGNFAIKREWQQFLQSLPVAKEFLHRDEWLKKYPTLSGYVLPAVFGLYADTSQEILSAAELNQQVDLASLMNILRKKLEHDSFPPTIPKQS